MRYSRNGRVVGDKMSGIEKRALQVVVAIGCLVPIGAGAPGAGSHIGAADEQSLAHHKEYPT